MLTGSKLGLIVLLVSLGLAGCASGDSPSVNAAGERPEISPRAIENTVELLEEDSLVREVFIGVDGEQVVISLAINHAITDDAAKEKLDNAVRYLASQAASEHDSLSSPRGDHLGDLWDHYTLRVVAGTGPEDIRVIGVKAPRAAGITW